MAGLRLLLALLGGRSFQLWLREMGGEISLGRSYLLRWAVAYWNLLPVKPGTGALAYYLKKHHDVSYRDYGSWLVAKHAVRFLLTGLLGLGVTLPLSLWGGLSLVVPVLFGILLTGCLAGFLLPFHWAYEGNWALLKVLSRFSAAWSEMRGRRWLLVRVAVLSLAAKGIGWLSLWLCFRLTGVEITLLGALTVLLLRSLGRVAAVVPRQLVVREAITGAGAMALGFTFAAGVVASVLARAVALVLLLVVGSLASRTLARGFAGALNAGSSGVSENQTAVPPLEDEDVGR